MWTQDRYYVFFVYITSEQPSGLPQNGEPENLFIDVDTYNLSANSCFDVAAGGVDMSIKSLITDGRQVYAWVRNIALSSINHLCQYARLLVIVLSGNLMYLLYPLDLMKFDYLIYVFYRHEKTHHYESSGVG